MGLFDRKPPEWKDQISVSLTQPDGAYGLWFYEVAAKDRHGVWTRLRGAKGYKHPMEARISGEIVAKEAYRDAIKRGIEWARLDAAPVPRRVDWPKWFVVSVRQTQPARGGLWSWEIAWTGDGAVNHEPIELTDVLAELTWPAGSDPPKPGAPGWPSIQNGYENESAARATGEITAELIYDELVRRGTIPLPPDATSEDEDPGRPTGGYTRATLRLRNDGKRGPGYFVVDASQHPEPTLAGPFDGQAEALAELASLEEQEELMAAIAAMSPAEREAQRADFAEANARVWADPVVGPQMRELGERYLAIKALRTEAEAEIAADPTVCRGTVDGSWIGDGPASCEYPAGHAGPHGWDGPY